MSLSVSWHLIAFAYFSYLAVAALACPRFLRARRAVVAAAIAASAVVAMAALPHDSARIPIALRAAIPIPVLLTGYWISGLFLMRPMHGVERWLGRMDARFLVETGVLGRYRRGPALVRSYFEMSYLMVYLIVPAGAAVLAVAGHAESLEVFWATVLLAAFACYGALPWIQTRPPRALEQDESTGPDLLRRLNLAVLNRGSVHANLVPSGHAACAVSVALVIWTAMPSTGAAFLVAALSITAATVLGRYHYVVDSVLGVAVGVIAWAAVATLQ